jgi:type II secretory pathway pseudopilin PulG
MIEVTMAMSLLGLGILGMGSVMLSTSTLAQINRENTLAYEAARGFAEQMQTNWPFELVFAVYNEDPEDDPTTGQAPGSTFQIVNSAYGYTQSSLSFAATGIIRFPVDTPGELREDVVDHTLGMPRDLNGDGIINADSRSSDYVLLPVSIQLSWQGVTGARSLTFRTLLSRR